MGEQDTAAIVAMEALGEPDRIRAGRFLIDLWGERCGKRSVWSLLPLMARPGDWVAALAAAREGKAPCGV